MPLSPLLSLKSHKASRIMDKEGIQNLSSTSIAILHTAASSRLLDCLTGVADLVASVHLLIDIFGATVNRRRYEEWV